MLDGIPSCTHTDVCKMGSHQAYILDTSVCVQVGIPSSIAFEDLI